MMKLYAWKPKGHGAWSFFVMAPDEATARAAVEAEMAKGDMGLREVYGWGTDYYTLIVALESPGFSHGEVQVTSMHST